jgi:hypothetical protein
MAVLFEALKGFYFFFSILIGLFFLRGLYIFPEEKFFLIGKLLMPAYLVLTGLMIGYVLGYLWIVKSDIKDQDVIEKIYAKALVI